MTGWKDWAIGEVVTESDFQSFVQDQVIQRYADATARDTTLGASVATGMACFLEDVSLFQVYDGTDWVEISGGGTTISDTAPAAPDVGDTWWDSTNGRFFVYFDSYWVEIALAQSGPQGATGATGSTGATGAAGSDGALSKNYIINGAFDVWQRGTSVSSTTFAYTADRWFGYQYGSFTVSRQTSGLTGLQYSARVQRPVGQTGTNGINFSNTSETSTSIPLAGQQVTLSFWAKVGADFSSASGVLNASVNSGTGTDERGIGPGFTGNVQFANAAIVPTTSWQRFSITGTVPTNSTQQLVFFNYVPTGTAGANDYFEITGVQLEAGDTATPFKRNSSNLQGELAACQRYYQRVGFPNNQGVAAFGYVRTATTARITIPTNVQMRTTPTLEGETDSDKIFYGTTGLTTATYTALGLSGIGVNLEATIPTTSVDQPCIASIPNLELSAEL